ncbi:MAG: 3-hydroxyacyl-ACP dehydratase FabZ [Candidatus Anammoxibacter sp.]
MSFEEVKRLLPQRNPFILIDRIVEFEDGKRVVCLKNVSANEPFFVGHFPDFEIMPGVLILEAMAQASIVLFKKGSAGTDSGDKVFLLVSVNKAHFSKPVFPGDQLMLEINVDKIVSTGAIVQGVARVNDTVVAKATLTFGVADKGTLS